MNDFIMTDTQARKLTGLQQHANFRAPVTQFLHTGNAIHLPQAIGNIARHVAQHGLGNLTGDVNLHDRGYQGRELIYQGFFQQVIGQTRRRPIDRLLYVAHHLLFVGLVQVEVDGNDRQVLHTVGIELADALHFQQFLLQWQGNRQLDLLRSRAGFYRGDIDYPHIHLRIVFIAHVGNGQDTQGEDHQHDHIDDQRPIHKPVDEYPHES